MKQLLASSTGMIYLLVRTGNAFIVPYSTVRTTDGVPCRQRRQQEVSFKQQPQLQGTIGHDDFANIFGQEEAAERRTRELAAEFRRPPKVTQESTSVLSDGNTTRIEATRGQREQDDDNIIKRKRKYERQ
jgi:hypothetical protein